MLYLIEQVGKVGKTKLQKLLFLSNLNSKIPSYDFFPYNYGPFSVMLQNDLSFLNKSNLISFDDDKYENKLSKLYAFNTSRKQAIDKTIEKFGKYKTNDLTKYVYTCYPFYAINSFIAEDLLSTSELEKVKQSKPEYISPVLFTIGYEHKSVDKYLCQLVENNIKLLIDVRASSFSMKKEFIGNRLASYCKLIDIEYIHIPELGIPTSCRKEMIDKTKLFDYYSKQIIPIHDDYLLKIFELIAQYKRVALTCFEAEHLECHRHILADAIMLKPDISFVLEHL